MKSIAVAAVFCGLVSVNLAAVLDYSSPSHGFQAQSGYSDDGYAKTETRCTPYFDTVTSDHCETYTERTCITTQKESCRDIPDQACRAVVTSKQTRKCFNVTEERCVLKEDVKFETIQVPFVVQKCQKVNERICDTVYDTSATHKENVQCINLENSKCKNVENTIYDVTCRTFTTFDCDTSYPDSYGFEASQGAEYGDNYGSTDPSYVSTTNSYGKRQPNCKRTTDTKCYKTPRTVTVQQCSPTKEKVCERLSVAVPFAQPRQSCRNEEKRVCDLEERTQPKQIKKFVYTKQCRPVPRSVCENADQKTLVPSCVGTHRKQCTYSPSESCTDEPKKHCYKVHQRVKKQRCETVTVKKTAYPNTYDKNNDY